MRIAFRAVEGGFWVAEFALLCGVSGTDDAGAEHYLTLQRSLEGDEQIEDWGVHVEFDGQGYGDYGCVQEYRLSRSQLAIDLSRQLGGLAEVTGFDVALALDDDTFAQIRAGLARIFRGMSEGLA